MPHFSTLGDIVVRTVSVYIFLLLSMRLMGKREVSQFMPFDFVLLLVLSNSVQNAMTGPDTSLPGGIIAATTLLILTRFMTWIGNRNRHLKRLLVGAPAILIKHGRRQIENMEHEHIDEDLLRQLLRENGYERPEQVDLLRLEVDGKVSIRARINGEPQKPAFGK